MNQAKFGGVARLVRERRGIVAVAGEDVSCCMIWRRETFSLMSVICEWMAWRDCWSLRAISEGRSLLTKYRQMEACRSVKFTAGLLRAVLAISSSLPYLLRR